ncbi:MAG: BatD family protein [Pseudomonadota bacterium]
MTKMDNSTNKPMSVKLRALRFVVFRLACVIFSHINSAYSPKDASHCTRHRYAHWLIALLMIPLLTSQSLLAAELTAWVDRSKIGLDETFTLIIKSTSMSIFDSPDLKPLEQDFEVLGTSRNSQHSIVNGKTESSLEWHVSLAAMREGALVIPPIEVDGDQTDAIIIQVSKSSFAEKSGGFDPVFIQSEIDNDEVYVQGQLILTVRIYYGVALSKGAQLSDLEVPNAVVKQLNEASYETRVRNMNYNVHEVKYAIFPQRSGSLEIPSQTFSALMASSRRSGSLFDNFGSPSRGRPIRAASETHAITVKPQSDEFTGSDWLPAENIELLETWSKELSELKAGEPITRSLIIASKGLQGSQLPPLDVAELQGAQQYPDQPETADELNSTGVIGTRIESQAIIPANGGQLRFPEVRLPWWNTRTNRQEVAVIPEQVLQVEGPLAAPTVPAPQSVQATNPTVTTPSNNQEKENADVTDTNIDTPAKGSVDSFWQYATILTLILWAATVLYFVLLRKQTLSTDSIVSKEPLTKVARASLSEACKENNPARIKYALIQWARSVTGKKQLSSLSAVASALPNDDLRRELAKLDAALYQSNSSSFDGRAIDKAVTELTEARKSRRSFLGPELEPLYRA